MHQCRNINSYYKVYIICKNCDIKINKYFCPYDVFKKQSRTPMKTA
jgi:hypothetical protein